MSRQFDYPSILIYFNFMPVSAIRTSDNTVQQQYRDNFARHILSVTLYQQAEIMGALSAKHQHSKLRINYEPYISIAGKSGARLSDIADILGISRQAANQTANQSRSSC